MKTPRVEPSRVDWLAGRAPNAEASSAGTALGPFPVAAPVAAQPPAPEHGIPGRLVLWTLRRFSWAALLAGAASAALALLALGSSGPAYQSEARVLVGQLAGSTDSLRASASLGQTYADALGSETTLRRVGNAAHLPPGSDQKLLTAVEVTFNDKSRLLSIDVTWLDAGTAHRISSLLVAEVQRLKSDGPTTAGVPNPTPDVRAQENTRTASGVLTVIQPATLPDRPVETHQSVLALLAALAGSLLAFTLLCFSVGQRHRRRMRVRGSLSYSDYLGSVTPARRSRGRHDPASARLVRGRRAIDYEEVAARIEMRAMTLPLGSICVVGTRDGPAAAEVALNLAAILATPGRRATVVDPTDSIHSVRLTRPHLSVVQVDSPQQESAIAARLLGSADNPGDELIVLTLPSLVSALAGSWWLTSAEGVILVGAYDDRNIELDLADCMDAVARRGGRLLGVILLRGSSLASRVLTPPENVTVS